MSRQRYCIINHWAQYNRFKGDCGQSHLITLGLERMMEALSILGNPQKRIQQNTTLIHVAGTNGKGSTIAFCRSILEKLGYRVHCYTSPHMIDFNERIYIGGQHISDDLLEEVFTQVMEQTAHLELRFFEAITLCGLLVFDRFPAHITLVEVGMGGRLDATNVFDQPRLCYITPIDFDHQEFLGKTIGEIAFEKCGIIKARSMVVSGKQCFEARKIIEKTCRARGASLFIQDEDFFVQGGQLFLRHQKNQSGLDLTSKSLEGPHQYDNAATAIAGLHGIHLIDVERDAHQIKNALGQTYWPARFQSLMIEIFKQHRCIVDGAHNLHGIRALKQCIMKQKENDPSPIVVVMAVKHDKPIWEMVNLLKDDVEHVFLSEFHVDEIKCWDTHTLQKQLEDKKNHHWDNVRVLPFDCIISHLSQTQSPKTIIFCGSLYFASYILKNHNSWNVEK
jgi:dihydrofolate synthase/folylpolyglutamate synthase